LRNKLSQLILSQRENEPRFVKQLALNSLRYSGLEADRKEECRIKFTSRSVHVISILTDFHG
jgi:hypothetical protein